MSLDILAHKVCWNSLTTASLKDLSTTHVNYMWPKLFHFQISEFHSFVYNMKKYKDLNKDSLNLLVNCITEGSPLWEAMQNNEKIMSFQTVILSNVFRDITLCQL